MMDKIIQFSIDNRLMVTLAALAFACAGGYVCTTVPVDVFPDLTAPTVVVLTEAAGMVPAEVENLATFPLETALNGAPGVRRVRSASMPGFSVVWAEFDWGAGMNEARQVVAERVAAAAADLPPEVSRPVLAPPSSIMGEIQLVALQSETHSRAALRDHADTVLRRRLQAVPGVAQVGVVGGDVRQFQAVADPARLAALDMTLGEVAEALRAENRNAAAGVIPGGGVEYQVTGLGRVRGVEDIAGVVAGVRGGVPVRVGDVAEVREGAEPVRGDGSANGRPAVLMYIQRQPDANTLALDGLLRVVLAEESARLPEGMILDTSLFRQADFIRTAVRNVAVALRDGSLLVALIMVAFLANARALLVTLVALPLSMIAAVLVIHRTGGTLNTMTLGGLAVAVGSLVDDAVIDVENIVRRLRENGARPPAERLSALRVVYLASAEVRAPIVFATCIIAVVFLPVYTLSGVEGRLLRPLSTAYIVSVFASLAVAIVLTPALSAWLLPGARSAREGREPRLAGWVRRGYTALLRPTMNRPWLVCAPAALLTAGACALLPLMGRSFLPEFNEGALNVVMSTLPGTSLEESSRLALLAEKTLLAQPGVVSVARKTGRGELDEHAQGAEGSEFEATFVLPEGMGKEALLSSLRRDLSKIPGAVFGMGGPISHRIDHILSGARAAIAVKISGPDLHTLRNLASRARAAMEAVPGVADLAVEPQADVPLVEVKFRRDALARNGVAFSEAETALRAAVHGAEVSRVHEGANTYGLAVRLDTPAARDPAALAALPLRSSGGATVPLGDVADIVRATGPNIITRDQVQRKIFITCNTAGRDVASLAAEIRERVDPLLAGAPGYTVSYGGQFESAARASRMLLLAGAATLAGVFLLLCAAFRSVRDALFVLLGLPLAVVGGVAGVYGTGGVLSLASIIGFISVFGVAARNGIMLIRHIRHLQEEEGVADFREAVLRGAGERVVPILMTALSTGLALVPLALHGDLPGNELQTPMAVVILSGLFSATLLNLAVAPALYARFGRPARRAAEGV